MPVSLVWNGVAVVSPVISDITETETSATSWSVAWDVSPISQGEVRYGTTNGGPYPFVTNRETAYLDHHAQNILGLTPGTTYYYVIWARTEAGTEDLSAEGTFTVSAAPSLDYPPAIPLAYLAKPVQAAPTVGQVITDPQYGTQVTRISSSTARVRYASKAVLNADQSLGLLDGTSGARWLFNGQTLVPIRLLSDTFGAFTWSTVDPNRAYAYSNPNVIRILDVTTAGISIARSIPLSDYSALILGGLQGSQSNDDSLLGIQWQKPNGNLGYSLFSTETETVVGEVTVATSGIWSGDGKLFDSCGISQTGTYFLGGFAANGTGTTQGQWRWPTASFTNANRLQLTTQNRHWDAGLMADGVTDVLWICSQNATGTSNGGYAGIFRFDNGAWTPMISNWPNGSPSCRNILRPGYGYISSFSDMDTNPTFPGYSTVIAVRFADPPVDGGNVEVYGNVHGPYSTAYTDQPNAAPSPDGTRVFTNTNWDGAPSVAFALGMDVVR
jgi:hypothetical protein